LRHEVRKDYDEAERLYRHALELDPDSPMHTGNLANFMWRARQDYDEAERLYRRALELDPDNPTSSGNFAAFLLATGHVEEAKKNIGRAWTLNKAAKCQLAAELILYFCLIARIEGRDDAPGLARLRWLLESGFLRDPWSFDQLLSAAAQKLTGEEVTLYAALADAILDPEKVCALEQYERWKALEPIPIDQSWDMSV
jgi:tetratricopeptide (TPR) repeat protein